MNTEASLLLERITKTKNTQKRGYQFQDFLRHLLSEARFEADANPRAARPRQSDLYAIKDDKHYLIEAKWQKRVITSAEIDDLRMRLQRSQAGIVGCLFSMTEFTQSAIDTVELEKQKMILLFGPKEIRDIAEKRWSLDDLIKQKCKTLMSDGRVWFSHEPIIRKKAQRLIFPERSRTILLNSKPVACFKTRNNDINDLIFATSIPEIHWGVLGGYGVGINIDLPIHTLAELKSFLALIHNQFGLTSEGSFAIRQMQCSWHGYGITNFVSEIERWKQRYADAKLSYVHHSEDIHFFDACDSGYCLISARQQVNHPTKFPLDSCQIRIHLSGIPVNLKPFERICEEARYNVQYFVPFHERISDHIRLKKPIPVKVAGQIVTGVNNGQGSVCGLVVENPFKNKKLIPRGKFERLRLSALSTPEFIICNLSDWHDMNDKIDQYRIHRIEAAQVGAVSVFYCVGTWDSIVDRKPRIFKKSLRQITDELAKKYRART